MFADMYNIPSHGKHCLNVLDNPWQGQDTTFREEIQPNPSASHRADVLPIFALMRAFISMVSLCEQCCSLVV